MLNLRSEMTAIASALACRAGDAGMDLHAIHKEAFVRLQHALDLPAVLRGRGLSLA